MVELAAKREDQSPQQLSLRLSFWRLGLGVAACSVAAVGVNEPQISIRSVAAYAALAWLGALYGTWRSRRGIACALTTYIFVFGLFHVGLVLSFATIGPSVLVGQGDNTWIYSPTVPTAVSAVCVALIALVIGAGISELVPLRQSSLERLGATPNIGAAGTVAMLVGSGIFSYVFASNGGVGLIGSGYGKVLESVGDNGLFGYGVFLLGIGCSFMVCAGGRYRRAGWCIMALFAAVALPIGMRGAVLFPILTMVVLEGRRNRINFLPFAVVVLTGLTLISILRQTRVGGLAALLGGNWVRASPIDGMAEMGYTLYPVVVVQNWISGGLTFLNGQTLIAPFIRQIESLFFNRSIPAAADSRLFNVEIMQMVGPIGGSPVAEGLRNGGPWFVFFLMLVLGLLVSRLDRMSMTPVTGAILAIIFLPLLIQVRNSFAPVLVQIVIGGLFLGIAFLAGTRTSEEAFHGKS